jgi:hypothetical protein
VYDEIANLQVLTNATPSPTLSTTDRAVPLLIPPLGPSRDQRHPSSPAYLPDVGHAEQPPEGNAKIKTVECTIATRSK